MTIPPIQTPQLKNPLPRWRGFNLLEKFTADDSSKSVRFDARNPAFREEHFQWISDWGFDFVRIPMSYHCWSDPEHWLEIDESVIAQLDDAVVYGQRHGVHVCLNLHRAPGYCINPPPEPRSLWRDADALAACVHHWRLLARRYRGISSGELSFDLLNEPPYPSEAMSRGDYERVVRTLVREIREIDPERLIIADGLGCGNLPMPELADLDIGQSCRGYLPTAISHYKASWVNSADFPPPRWPGAPQNGEPWNRGHLEAHFGEWAALIPEGVGVHCGECGCFNQTPHAVFLDWFRDVLEVLEQYSIGFALWNFRGAFGILDSGRKDVVYEDWHGHALDTALLKLLQEQ